MGAPGFDDAPLCNTVANESLKDVTAVYPYYENPVFLTKQLEGWSRLSPTVREHLRVIVVDDGSPKSPACAVLSDKVWPFDVKLYRIEVDVRWNWLAARNIGMMHAKDGWCALTDMDHVLTEETLTSLMGQCHNPAVIYRFSRREHTGQAIHPHPNSMFMTREMFWKVGGYDEALSGHYGTDGDWRRRCAATAAVYTLRCELERHEYQSDSSTTSYKRKQPEDAGKKAIIAKRGKGWRPKVLSFPYHQVQL